MERRGEHHSISGSPAEGRVWEHRPSSKPRPGQAPGRTHRPWTPTARTRLGVTPRPVPASLPRAAQRSQVPDACLGGCSRRPPTPAGAPSRTALRPQVRSELWEGPRTRRGPRRETGVLWGLAERVLGAQLPRWGERGHHVPVRGLRQPQLSPRPRCHRTSSHRPSTGDRCQGDAFSESYKVITAFRVKSRAVSLKG